MLTLAVHHIYRPNTPPAPLRWAPFSLVHMSVCGLLNRHCSSLGPNHSASQSALHPLHLSSPGWLGCDLIRRTRGETKGSGCSERETKVSTLSWLDRTAGCDRCAVPKGSGGSWVSQASRARCTFHLIVIFIVTEQGGVIILLLGGESTQSPAYFKGRECYWEEAELKQQFSSRLTLLFVPYLAQPACSVHTELKQSLCCMVRKQKGMPSRWPSSGSGLIWTFETLELDIFQHLLVSR